MAKNKWCNKQGNYCIAADGTTIDLRNKNISDLKKELNQANEQCSRRIEDINSEIDKMNVNKSISAGPCITIDGKYGIILPQKYGKKCVSMSDIKKNMVDEGKNGNKIDRSGNGKGNGKDEKDKDKKLTKEEIDKKYKDQVEKDRLQRKGIVGYDNGRYYKGETDCLPVGTDFNKICKLQYGKYSKATIPERCACPLKTKELCQKNIREMAKCYCELPENKKYTDCRIKTTDFNYECQAKYGRQYGYKEIINKEDSCCPEDMRQAECDSSYYKGMPIMKNTIECIPTNNYYKHLEKCRLTYPDRNVVGIKNINGINCNPAYFRSTCVFS